MSDEETPEFLYRLGLERESRDSLDQQANLAVERGFPRGVPVYARSDRADPSQARYAEVIVHFRVHKTGRAPYHYTIELPNPLSEADAEKFNDLLGRHHP